MKQTRRRALRVGDRHLRKNNFCIGAYWGQYIKSCLIYYENLSLTFYRTVVNCDHEYEIFRRSDIMNDIKWRSVVDDWEYIDYPDNRVIVKTNVAIRISWAKSIHWQTAELTDCNEKALEYAFFE